MAVCAICGEKLGIFDRELCTDGFICKKCRSFFSDFKVDYKTASIKSMKEQRAFFKERQERAKGFEDLQDPGTMVAYVNREQRLMTVSGIPGWFTFDELADYTVEVDTKTVTETKGGLTRAVVGGIVVGSAGAIIGGNTAKTVSHTVESDPKMSFTVDYPAPIGRMTSPVFTYSRKVLELCEEIFADRAVSKDEKGTSSAADELLKFKKLLDMGAITEDEYKAQKARLLNL